jgi:hypothetical protein
VVGAQVAVLADAFSVEVSVVVLALESLLGPTPGVVAVLAHTIGIVFLVGMSAL